MNNKETKLPYRGKVGRKPKSDPACFRHAISLNEVQNVAFLARFDKSRMKVKAHFIMSCIFDKPLRVVKLDKAAIDYYMRLTTFYSQFRAIGVNYNQVVETLRTTFGDKKALVFLAKLEKATLELAILNHQITDLTQGLEAKIYKSEESESDPFESNNKKKSFGR